MFLVALSLLLLIGTIIARRRSVDVPDVTPWGALVFFAGALAWAVGGQLPPSLASSAHTQAAVVLGIGLVNLAISWHVFRNRRMFRLADEQAG